MSYSAERRYIDTRSGRVKTNVLLRDADILPRRHTTFKDFKASFGNSNYFEITISGCFIVVDLKYAYSHFTKNTYSDYRSNINGTLLATLRDPILIVQERYNGEPVIALYKSFKTQNNLYHIVMFKAFKKENGKYYFKTIYDIDGNMSKVKKIIKATDRSTIYFKYE